MDDRDEGKDSSEIKILTEKNENPLIHITINVIDICKVIFTVNISAGYRSCCFYYNLFTI